MVVPPCFLRPSRKHILQLIGRQTSDANFPFAQLVLLLQVMYCCTARSPFPVLNKGRQKEKNANRVGSTKTSQVPFVGRWCDDTPTIPRIYCNSSPSPPMACKTRVRPPLPSTLPQHPSHLPINWCPTYAYPLSDSNTHSDTHTHTQQSGHYVWPAAPALSAYLVDRRLALPGGGRCLELGAGCGLAGLVAAQLPLTTAVVFTDHDPGGCWAGEWGGGGGGGDVWERAEVLVFFSTGEVWSAPLHALRWYMVCTIYAVHKAKADTSGWYILRTIYTFHKARTGHGGVWQGRQADRQTVELALPASVRRGNALSASVVRVRGGLVI